MIIQILKKISCTIFLVCTCVLLFKILLPFPYNSHTQMLIYVISATGATIFALLTLVFVTIDILLSNNTTTVNHPPNENLEERNNQNDEFLPQYELHLVGENNGNNMNVENNSVPDNGSQEETNSQGTKPPSYKTDESNNGNNGNDNIPGTSQQA